MAAGALSLIAAAVAACAAMGANAEVPSLSTNDGNIKFGVRYDRAAPSLGRGNMSAVRADFFRSSALRLAV